MNKKVNKMKIFAEIHRILRARYDSGATQQELANQSGISCSYLGRLLNGKREISGITLDSFFKLFPKAQIILEETEVSEESALERKLLSTFRELSEDDQLEVLMYMGKLRKDKSAGVATASTQKIS